VNSCALDKVLITQSQNPRGWKVKDIMQVCCLEKRFVEFDLVVDFFFPLRENRPVNQRKGKAGHHEFDNPQGVHSKRRHGRRHHRLERLTRDWRR
jgi:hypothetical protein